VRKSAVEKEVGVGAADWRAPEEQSEVDRVEI
jgi:hypothetical protein